MNVFLILLAPLLTILLKCSRSEPLQEDDYYYYGEYEGNEGYGEVEIEPSEPICSPGAPKMHESRYNLLGSAFLIFPGLTIDCEGEISQWEFLTRNRNMSQLNLAIWHLVDEDSKLSNKSKKFKLRGKNVPFDGDFAPNVDRWTSWTVSFEKRIKVKRGDVIGYFYAHLTVNQSSLVLPIATPLGDLISNKMRYESVFAALLDSTDFGDKNDGEVVVDFATQGSYLPKYALPPLRAIVTPPKIVRQTTTQPTTTTTKRSRKNTTKQPTTRPLRSRTPPFYMTTTPDTTIRTSPSREANIQRCSNIPAKFDETQMQPGCRMQNFLRFYYSSSLRTCVYFPFLACTNERGKLPYPIKNDNNFNTMENCLKICEALLDPNVEPILPSDDYSAHVFDYISR